MPNLLAHIVLLAWPLVIYAMFRLMPLERALIWAILGGYMLLPEGTAFNPPMIPALNKITLPNLTALVIIMLVLGRRIVPLPESLLGKALIALFILSPVVTVLNNAEPVAFGSFMIGSMVVQGVDPDIRSALPGLRPYDAIAFVGNQLFLMLPLFLARQFLATPRALRELVGALVIAALIYSIPMWYEVRFSPQLHTMIYGFFQHDFTQAMRQGGFRPFVFMPHGLWVAFFTLMAVVCATSLARHATPEERPRRMLVAAYLGVLLLACKTLGANLMALALVPMVLLLGVRWQVRIAAAAGAVAMIYPFLRGIGIAPVWQFHALIEARNPERAQSFVFRLINEDRLLERAAEKPLFGWGSWGRNLVHDPLTGEVQTISDGYWIIVIGTHGWLGYVATFGLLALPLLALWWAMRRIPDAQLSPWIGPLALLLGANMIDLIPNATLVPLTWLLAGALLGHAELLQRQRRDERRAALERSFSSPVRAGLLATARPGAAVPGCATGGEGGGGPAATAQDAPRADRMTLRRGGRALKDGWH